MRVFALALCTSMLAACSGAGPETIGNIPAPDSPKALHTFVNPTEQKVYNAIGGTQTYKYDVIESFLTNVPGGQTTQIYAGNASTVRQTGITVDYNPRDAIFDINIKDPASTVTTRNRFQDPLHRTAFGGAREPQLGVPNLSAPGIQYLQSGVSASTIDLTDPGRSFTGELRRNESTGQYSATSYFYQKPGTTTQYVTFTGYVKNTLDIIYTRVSNNNVIIKDEDVHAYELQRGAFVFGENTKNGDVPITGTGSYSGAMLTSMVFNDQNDNSGFQTPTYYQWIEGSANTQVDFLNKKFTLNLTGTTFAPQLDRTRLTASIQSGAAFNANGSGQIDLVQAGGFIGQFQQAWLVNPDGTRFDILIGGSSINGTFFGPTAQEVGGGYRIVGGVPDQRVDLLGTFVGK
jgi:hypothetical protein